MNKIGNNLLRVASTFFDTIKEIMVTTWHLIKTTNLKFLLAIPLLTYIYFAFTMPISHDEAYTYLYFIKPPFWVGASYYPAPNNHLFYSLLANITESIPFLDLRFAVRLPAIFASLLTLIIIYRFVQKYYSDQMAALVVSFTSIGVMYILYSFYARGYSLLVLFTVWCFYMAFNIVKEGNQTRHWVLFAVSGILGFYTMPSFLYPFVSINLFILCYNYKKIGRLIYYNVWIVIIVFLLYLPVVVVSGIDSIINNQFVIPIDRLTVLHRLPGFLVGTITELFGLPYYIVLPLIAGVLIYTIVRKEKQLLLLWLFFWFSTCTYDYCAVGDSILSFFHLSGIYNSIFVIKSIQ